VTLWLCGCFSLCLSFSLCLRGQTLGHITFPTSGAASAQPHFIRGVLLLHSFEYDPAIAEFREAQRIDPAFAMAYWGEAMCYDQPLWYHEEPAKARAVLARLGPDPASRHAKAPTPREQLYLDAVDTLFGSGDKPSRGRAYADAMARLAREFPDDDEAAAFYALALLATIPQGERNPDVSLRAGAIASAILKRNPEHPGAAHYALHAYDDGEHAAMGLEAARTYAKIAPASSHARHMPSHVFLPLGLWDEAVASDTSAFAASVEYVKRNGLSASQLDFHSLSWLHYEYLQQGRFAKARELMEPVRTAASETPSKEQHAHVESEIGRGFGAMPLRSELASMRARLVVESGNWAEMKGQASFDNIDELFALGLSAVKLGDLGRADAAIEHLDTAATTVTDRDAREIAAIMAAELDGLLRTARGDRTRGFESLSRATSLESRRPPPVGRPYPIKPAAELYGEALLASGDPRSAIQQFRSALKRTPNRAVALLGLAEAAQKAGLSDDSADAAQKFLMAWHLADAGRREIAQAKGLARHPGK
jgi:tetratricopeptide (TPR) repeat protein